MISHEALLIMSLIAASAFPIMVLSHIPKPPEKKTLRPTASSIGKKCNHEVYSELFFNRHIENTSSIIHLLTEGNFTLKKNQDEVLYFRDFLDQLCLIIDDNNTIDIHSLDCILQLPDLPQTCTCGRAMDSIDPNVHGTENHQSGSLKPQFVTVNLNRKLVQEGNQCLSGHFGHCNPDLPIPLNCASGLQCQFIKIDVSTIHNGAVPKFINKETGAEYGTCLSRVNNDIDVALRAEIEGASTSLHTSTFLVWTFILIISELML